ncbi:MAG: ATP-binding protein [Spirochaetales bacterium]|uniref:ATP-binding protein n=1 Tax=Candidatus Thalassospirochaeta sargassi TaxID=3119039 RepID=A0AAJ1IK61_9SPIO|nr:ATP-binding protein [Spirochaetales bacterium]
MKTVNRGTRYKWDNQRSTQVFQFLLRLLPLVIILILSAGFVWVYRNADLRNRLDESVFETSSSKTLIAVKDYFSPLTEFIFSSVLWGRVGEIDSVGEPEDYIELLQARFASIGTVSSFSLTDPAGRELVLKNPYGDSDWFTTEKNNEDSLTYLRNAGGFAESDRPSGSGVRISTVYSLPYLDEPGISLYLQSPFGNAGEGLSIAVDLPLRQMSERLKEDGAVKDAVLFILLPAEEDYIFLPVGNLLKLPDTQTPELDFETATPLDSGADSLISFLDENIPGDQDDDLQLRYETEAGSWMTEFLLIDLGDDELIIGTLVPVESLWTSQFSVPLQLFLLTILAAAAFLLYRLVNDYREASRSPYRIEEILREEIGKGESSKLEFKSSLRWDYREDKVNKALEDIIVKSIAAFSNARGGTLLIGVADSGEILGIEKDYAVLRQEGRDYYEIHLRNLLGSRYGVGYTSKNIAVDFPWLSGHEICRIRIRRGRQPLFTTVKSKNGSPVEKFFIRSGNTSQVLDNPSEITNYILTRFSRWRIGKSFSAS